LTASSHFGKYIVIQQYADNNFIMHKMLKFSDFFTHDSRMLHASQPSSRRLSVRPSVTPWHCIKTATPSITKSSLWASFW